MMRGVEEEGESEVGKFGRGEEMGGRFSRREDGEGRRSFNVG